MKIQSGILALCIAAGCTNAFSVVKPLTTISSSSSVVLKSTQEGIPPAPLEAGPPEPARPPTSVEIAEGFFPDNIPLERVEGGGTVRTFKMPPHAERVQYIFKSNGRPMKAKVELWLGPIRRVHFNNIDVEDGDLTPFRGTIKFKKMEPTLKVSTESNAEFPVYFGVHVPDPEESKRIGAVTDMVFDSFPRTKIQGGNINPTGGGAIKTFPIPANVDAVQVLIWSKDVGKKSFKTKIEVLQGPTNVKQSYDIQCGGSTQPYHPIIETPGDATTLRMYNKKFVEDGLFQVVVVPYRYGPVNSGPRIM